MKLLKKVQNIIPPYKIKKSFLIYIELIFIELNFLLFLFFLSFWVLAATMLDCDVRGARKHTLKILRRHFTMKRYFDETPENYFFSLTSVNQQL